MIASAVEQCATLVKFMREKSTPTGSYLFLSYINQHFKTFDELYSAEFSTIIILLKSMDFTSKVVLKLL